MRPITCRRAERAGSASQLVLHTALVAALAASAVPATEAAAAEQAATMGIEEITVTARRREESQVEVPISIALVSGERLAEDSITRSQDLQYLVPSLSVVTFLGGANVSLRGVGTGQNVSGADESVGVYIDEIYQGTTSSSFSRMFDVERVEVLKGPQGTLYGRNVTAGAINVVSRAPVLGESSGALDLSYGSFETVRGNASLNLPLGDRAAVRVAITGANGDGFVENIDTGRTLNGEDYFGGRIRLRAQPTDAFTIDASLQYLRDETPVAFETLPFEPGFLGFQRTRVPQALNGNLQKVLNGVVRLEYRLSDSWLVRSISGYMNLENEHRFSGPANVPNPTVAGATQIDRPQYTQFSQELQAQWTSGRSAATLGAYYLDSELTNQRNICFCVFGLTNYQNAIDEQPVDAWAVFGETEFAVTDTISLIAGLRYGDEKRGLSVTPGTPPGITDPAAPYAGSASFSATTGRFGLRYQPDPATSYYVTASRGFKAGGTQTLDGASGPVVGRFEPEYLNAYEIGAKRYLGERGIIEAAAFYYDYTDLQVFQVLTLFDFQVVNAPEATIKGVDLSMQYRLADHWSTSLSVGYLDATYEKFDFRAAGGAQVDLSGFRLPRSPEWSSSAQLVFDRWQLFGLEGSIRAEVNYRDAVVSVPDTPARMATGGLPSVALVNLVGRMKPSEDSGLGFSLNLRNLTDREYYEFNGGGGLIGGQSAPGRTYEFGISYQF